MYKVRFMPYRDGLATIMHRQTPGHNLRSQDGRYEFCLDDSLDEADFWVVQGKGVRDQQTCRVAPENTILLTTEPRSVLVYPQRYIDQFGLVISCQEQMHHRHVQYGPAILPWFVGYQPAPPSAGIPYTYSQDYDSLSQPSDPAEKTKLISVITSNKAFTRGHLDRIKFVEKLKARFGDQLDIFGRGFRSFDDKWDVLRPYKYHIAIENSSERYYWTEKISDCYLTGTFPIYHGCTNLADYFSRDAFEPIDIRKPEQAIRIIEQQLQAQRYEQSVAALDAMKQRVLGEYNMFEYVARLCDQMNPDAPKQTVTIHPCKSGMDWRNMVHYAFSQNYYKLQTKLHFLRYGNQLQSK
ncbi:glycosyltransferase family 10 domain-containing protein [Xylanibacter brevis]|uniref:glycosyltransferase family 10 domain-containing protein n=1 Tax=Xylanibacter brevis TaxID=83231 RepID=UPI000488FB67|nr:glycosyltransferase family 10 [Xylanibacter brevis]